MENDVVVMDYKLVVNFHSLGRNIYHYFGKEF